MSNKIRLAGTGVMGRAVIEKMISSGQGITAYDPFPEALEKATGLGAEVVGSPAELVRGAEMVIILLPGPAEIEKLVRGPEGLLARAEGAPILVDMSTSDPAAASASEVATNSRRHSATRCGACSPTMIHTPVAPCRMAVHSMSPSQATNRASPRRSTT